MGDKPRCAMPDCGRPVRARRFCSRHYARLRREGQIVAYRGTPHAPGGSFFAWLRTQIGTEQPGKVKRRKRAAWVWAHEFDRRAIPSPVGDNLHDWRDCVDRWGLDPEGFRAAWLTWLRDLRLRGQDGSRTQQWLACAAPRG